LEGTTRAQALLTLQEIRQSVQRAAGERESK